MSSSLSTSTTSSLTGKLTPNLDQHCTKKLNLTVLQRIDPFIEEILMIAAHVTLYEFNLDLNQWSRKDVEGSLFVVKRNTQPRFQFIVMNRLSTENLVEDLLSDFEFEIQVPYLLYRNAAQEVNGIWFYNTVECEEVANLFTRILNAYSKVPPKPQATPTKSEFEELEAVPTSAVIEGPLEPSVNPTISSVQPEDSSFENFFSTAMNMQNSFSKGLQSGQLYHTSAPTAPLSHVSNVTPSYAPTVQAQPFSGTSSSVPMMTTHDGSDHISSNRVANLVKPSSFLVTSSSSSLLIPPVSSISSPALHPLLNLQRPHGTPMLQPFPPPTPPPSLTANPTTVTEYGPVTREKVRDALLMLVQGS
ncbi:mRNA-decapping enzyme-like protein isoform X2 [Coffea arabica]|uniref:mRNA-decapping enzyme-like protein isoform X2 n=1 Tax=Coffea arabica TaxID=13443 RepID=A0ABM4UMF0_COFAR